MFPFFQFFEILLLSSFLNEDDVVCFPGLVQGKTSSFVRSFCKEAIRCARPRPSVIDVSPYGDSGDVDDAKVCKEAR